MRHSCLLLPAFLFLTPAAQSSPLDQADPARGKALYGPHCAACHGVDGRGLVPGTPDFTRDRELFAKGWEQVFERTRDGFQSPGSPMAMPPRGGAELSDEELWDIMAYLKQKFYADE